MLDFLMKVTLIVYKIPYCFIFLFFKYHSFNLFIGWSYFYVDLNLIVFAKLVLKEEKDIIIDAGDTGCVFGICMAISSEKTTLVEERETPDTDGTLTMILLIMM